MNAMGMQETGISVGDPTAAIAAWLAGVFIAPMSVDVVTEYCSPGGAVLLQALGDELGCNPGIDRMRLALDGDASPREIQRRLSIAYNLLFEGVHDSQTVALYESAYNAQSSRLFQQATADMESMLQHCGLTVAADCCEPPDHLSIELALLGALLQSESQQHVGLLRDRLLTWIPEFADRCNDADTSGFYSGAAMVLHEFLAAPALRNAGTTS
jgi:TorA specific chaperone